MFFRKQLRRYRDIVTVVTNTHDEERELVRVITNTSLTVQPASNDAIVLWLGLVFTGEGNLPKTSTPPWLMAFLDRLVGNREVWPLMIVATALTNQQSSLLVGNLTGDENVDGACLLEGIASFFDGAMLGQ